MNPEFWKGKRVLVTGHTGFKGSWLALWLQNLGANVIGYSLQPPTNPSLFEIAYVAKGMKSLAGDVRDLEHLKSCVTEDKPDIIIHMAAQSLVRRSYKHPVETYATNVMGTVNVFEAARRTESVRVVVNVTSDKCYENKAWVWGYRENDPMGGHDPYSSSKGCAELVTSAYRRSFFASHSNRCVGLASVRAGNVIGGGDWAKDRLIPDVVKAVAARKAAVIRNPGAVRPWQHVLDPLHGYLMLAERLWEQGDKYAGGWNFGPNDDETKPVSWVVERLIELWGDGACWETDQSEHPHEASYLKLDCSKARSKLGWQPRLSLAEALEWTVNWYHAYQSHDDMRAYTLEQISLFKHLERL